jgi:regulator of sigma E protease
LVLVHETGHFIAAKLSGVRVWEFGVGFGPSLGSFKFHDTRYTLNSVPLGGYVRIAGEVDPDEPGGLATRPRPVRFFVLSAGALANLIFAVVLFSVSFMIPQEVSVGRAVIGQVLPDSPAAAAGLQTGDVLYRIDGRDIQNVSDASYNIRLHMGETMNMQVKRGTEFLNFDVKARWVPPSGQGPTGIVIASQYPFTETQSYAPWKAFRLGWRETFDSLTITRNYIISWVKGGAAPQVAGPVGIAQMTGEVVKEAGWKSLVDFGAMISINLAVVNILPFPFFDGGRIVFVLAEVLRRGRRVAPEKEALVHFAGLVVIAAFIVVISYFDVLRLIRGESFF